MRTFRFAPVCALLASALLGSAAQAAKPCDELKAEIAAKLEAKGLKVYTLEVVAPDQVGSKQVVGSCDNGSKRIVYLRG